MEPATHFQSQPLTQFLSSPAREADRPGRKGLQRALSATRRLCPQPHSHPYLLTSLRTCLVVCWPIRVSPDAHSSPNNTNDAGKKQASKNVNNTGGSLLVPSPRGSDLRREATDCGRKREEMIARFTQPF